jgi:hypothetical protein
MSRFFEMTRNILLFRTRISHVTLDPSVFIWLWKLSEYGTKIFAVVLSRGVGYMDVVEALLPCFAIKMQP